MQASRLDFVDLTRLPLAADRHPRRTILFSRRDEGQRMCLSARTHTAAPAEHPRAQTTVLFIATATTCDLTRAAAVRRANPPTTILQPPGQAFERRAHRCRPTRVGESIIRISRKSIHPERQDKARRAWCARDTEIQSTDKK